MKVVYMTGNKFKLLAANNILEPIGIEVENKVIDCPEIQADTIEEVAKFSSKYASDYLKEATLKNDSGLIIPALNGFLAAYTKYVDQTLGIDGILKLMDGIENREAYFLEVLAYIEYGKEPVTFTSKTEGTLAKSPSGENGWSWDFIFIPKGMDKTLACYPDDERWKLWNDSGYIELANYLKEKAQTEQKNQTWNKNNVIENVEKAIN